MKIVIFFQIGLRTVLFLGLVSLARASSDADSHAPLPSDLYAHMLASAATAVEYAEPAVVSPVVSSQYHAQDELGRYEYGYSNPTATKGFTCFLESIISAITPKNP